MSAVPSVVVGVDLVRISEVSSSVERFGKRFLERVYTPHELRYCLAVAELCATRLAGRFAVKEAALKVLRVDNRQAVSWRSIEVRRTSAGWCELALHGAAAALAAQAGLSAFSVSLSHEGDYASAVVLAERERAGGKPDEGDNPGDSTEPWPPRRGRRKSVR